MCILKYVLKEMDKCNILLKKNCDFIVINYHLGTDLYLHFKHVFASYCSRSRENWTENSRGKIYCPIWSGFRIVVEGCVNSHKTLNLFTIIKLLKILKIIEIQVAWEHTISYDIFLCLEEWKVSSRILQNA